MTSNTTYKHKVQRFTKAQLESNAAHENGSGQSELELTIAHLHSCLRALDQVIAALVHYKELRGSCPGAANSALV